MRVYFTKGEWNWITWALDVMRDAAGEEMGYQESDVPECGWGTLKPERRFMEMPLHPDVFEDLMYRLEYQAPDVCQTDAPTGAAVAARARPAYRAADKIRGAQ